jgi:uncharacterized protein (TIGR03382 family)
MHDGISAALAQAEILSIFARQGLDAGYRWTTPGGDQPLTQDAFRMYLSYDGAGGRVLGTSIQSGSSSVDAVAGYGVVSGTALFVALFNKSTSAQNATVNLQNATLSGAAGTAWGFTETARYGQLGPLAPSGASSFSLSLPARSARLVKLPLQGTISGTCGDGTCQAGESSAGCSADCGEASGGTGSGSGGIGSGSGRAGSGCASSGGDLALFFAVALLLLGIRRRRCGRELG